MATPKRTRKGSGTESPKRCILFARTATAEQGESSLDRQIEALRKHAADHGFVVIHEHRLAGVSGTGTAAEFENLIKRKSEQNDFDAVLVTGLDRVARDHAKMISLQQQLIHGGIELVDASTAPDTTMSALMQMLEQSHVEWDRNIRSQRAKQAWAKKKRKGGGTHE